MEDTITIIYTVGTVIIVVYAVTRFIDLFYYAFGGIDKRVETITEEE